MMNDWFQGHLFVFAYQFISKEETFLVASLHEPRSYMASFEIGILDVTVCV